MVLQLYSKYSGIESWESGLGNVSLATWAWRELTDIVPKKNSGRQESKVAKLKNNKFHCVVSISVLLAHHYFWHIYSDIPVQLGSKAGALRLFRLFEKLGQGQKATCLAQDWRGFWYQKRTRTRWGFWRHWRDWESKHDLYITMLRCWRYFEYPASILNLMVLSIYSSMSKSWSNATTVSFSIQDLHTDHSLPTSSFIWWLRCTNDQSVEKPTNIVPPWTLLHRFAPAPRTPTIGYPFLRNVEEENWPWHTSQSFYIGDVPYSKCICCSFTKNVDHTTSGNQGSVYITSVPCESLGRCVVEKWVWLFLCSKFIKPIYSDVIFHSWHS